MKLMSFIKLQTIKYYSHVTIQSINLINQHFKLFRINLLVIFITLLILSVVFIVLLTIFILSVVFIVLLTMFILIIFIIIVFILQILISISFILFIIIIILVLSTNLFIQLNFPILLTIFAKFHRSYINQVFKFTFSE